MGEFYKVRAAGDSGDGDPVVGAETCEEAAEEWLEKAEDSDTEPTTVQVEVWSPDTQRWWPYTVRVEARLLYTAEADD